MKKSVNAKYIKFFLFHQGKATEQRKKSQYLKNNEQRNNKSRRVWNTRNKPNGVEQKKSEVRRENAAQKSAKVESAKFLHTNIYTHKHTCENVSKNKTLRGEWNAKCNLKRNSKRIRQKKNWQKVKKKECWFPMCTRCAFIFLRKCQPVGSRKWRERYS